MKLYIDASSGVSGDMFVGMLLDMGANKDKLMAKLNGLGLKGWRISIEEAQKHSIVGTKFSVALEQDITHSHHHDSKHSHHHVHRHDNEHTHNIGYIHTHEHRSFLEVKEILSKGNLEEAEKQLAITIFRQIAIAEATAHGVDVEQVHFHEVGAVDSIIDVVGAAVCLIDLNITEISCRSICDGYGSIACQHGVISIPVPAVVNIAKRANISISLVDEKGELTTPTGMGIVASLYKNKIDYELDNIASIGIGIGQKDFNRANILRGYLLNDESINEEIYICETNIDDVTSEQLGYVAQRLLDEKALDVWFEPIFMKKFRPAYKLSVLSNGDNKDEVIDIIIKETRALGVRYYKVKRKEVQRRVFEDNGVCYKEFKIKGNKYIKVEYDDIAKVALEEGITFLEAKEKLDYAKDK